HASDKHKSLACNACHKIPTAWSAKREFPDVADFPDHDACVRCHRQQFFTRQSFVGTGPTICTVCHVRAAPREDTRFAFGKPNNSVCQATNMNPISSSPATSTNTYIPPAGTFKTAPRAHDACFNCHWKNLKPASGDCAGCHKPAEAFMPANWPKRISIKFSHEG